MTTQNVSAAFESFDMDSVADLPEFVNFPAGTHTAAVTLKLEVKPGKEGKADQRVVKLTMKYLNSEELADASLNAELQAGNFDNLPKPGDMDSVAFYIDNEYGAGALKKIVNGSFKERFNTTNLVSLQEQVKDLECRVTTKTRKSVSKTTGDEMINTDIVALEVL